MRLNAFGELERSWLVDSVRRNAREAGLEKYLSSQPVMGRRRILFIRLNQTMSGMIAGIPSWRLLELAGRVGRSLPSPLPSTQDLLQFLDINLSVAREVHESMGGDPRINELNGISTQFTALSKRDIEDLSAHACWQVHAMHAIYWDN